MLYILAAIVTLVIGNYVSKNWRKWKYRKNLQFAVPVTKRTDLYFGYYGCINAQVAETEGHVNMLNEVQFEATTKVAQNIVNAGLPVMLGLSPQLMARADDKSKYTVRPDAEAHLLDFFNYLRLLGALQFVKLLTPVDEPNNTVASVEVLREAVAIIRKVANQFHELNGYKLYCIYAADKELIGQEMFDWIGFDDYDMQSHVLVGDKYRALKASLRPDQRTIIIPGGAYGQDPKPFVDFAQSNPEVAAVMPFLWLDDQWGTVGAPGIRSNGMKDQYINAGKSVI